MKALTVRQPWAWAIIHGGKNVENRTQRWSYRGPLAIHAGGLLSYDGLTDDRVKQVHPAANQALVDLPPKYFLHKSALIGIVDLVDVHEGYYRGCCRPWGDVGVGPSGYSVMHLVLENPRPIRPISCKGRLGLWNVDAEIEAVIEVPA